MALAKESDNTIDFDSGSLNPGFSYTDADNKEHEVWYLDAVTLWNQIQVLKNSESEMPDYGDYDQKIHEYGIFYKKRIYIH